MSEILKRPEPYVGISGVVNPEQQERIENIAASLDIRSSRQLALGVKAVHKTQFLDIKNKYGEEWYPVGQGQFEGAVSPKSDTSTSLAVAQTFFDLDYVENPGYRDYFSDRIFKRGAAWIDGIQFDMLPWHSRPEMLDFLVRLKKKHDTKLFLQVHGPAMEALGPTGVTDRLSEYSNTIDYILFDASHGTGTKLDTNALEPFLEKAYAAEPLETIGFAIAGGLNGELVHTELPKLLESFPDLSWDAEGQLHPTREDGTRPLDIDLVQAYLKATAAVTTQV